MSLDLGIAYEYTFAWRLIRSTDVNGRVCFIFFLSFFLFYGERGVQTMTQKTFICVFRKVIGKRFVHTVSNSITFKSEICILVLNRTEINNVNGKNVLHFFSSG